MSDDNSGDVTIGLFGTCGGSAWRDPFMRAYAERGIPFFNPQVEDWRPELAEREAWHLVHDELLLFPVTDETYAVGSLAESGFSVLSALRWNSNRFVVVYIAPDVGSELATSNPFAARESRRARQLVLAHLEKTHHPNVFVVESLDAMLPVSLALYNALQGIRRARALCV